MHLIKEREVTFLDASEKLVVLFEDEGMTQDEAGGLTEKREQLKLLGLVIDQLGLILLAIGLNHLELPPAG